MLRFTARGRTEQADLRADEAFVEHLAGLWPRACEGAGLYHRIDTVSGPTIRTPDLLDITLGPPLIFVIRLLPGQLPDDVGKVVRRLAAPFSAYTARITPLPGMRVRVEFIAADPLTATVPLVYPTGGRTFIGVDEAGTEIVDDWTVMPHVIVQGVTRSGKSGWLYAQLAQLARRPHTLIAGSDPSGLLWRPWQRRWGHDWRVCGLADLQAHARLLDALVADMDRRIHRLPADRDTAELGPDNPLLVIVLEEYPGLLRAAESTDRKLLQRIKAAVGRLAAESHKAGIRLVLVAQRAESTVIDGFVRAMCGYRVSFRVDGRDSLQMLHPSTAVEYLDEHLTAAPGVALVTAPGRDLARIRGPWIGTYGDYAAAVTGH